MKHTRTRQKEATPAELRRDKDALLRGETRPGRVTQLIPDGKGGYTRRDVNPEAWRRQQAAKYAASIAGVRAKLGLSQQQFADMLGISRRTLENWEQGHREPTGAARVLIRIAAKHPEAILEAV
ncbi:MAG: helix-turn-helix domain-containing protein [Opitutaceae bacterium]